MQILSFIGFTCLVAIIAYYKSRNSDETSSDGYFLGGRSLTGVVIAGSLLLTNLSTEQIIGLNGAASLSLAVALLAVPFCLPPYLIPVLFAITISAYYKYIPF
mgnify:CR=1 FL=1